MKLIENLCIQLILLSVCTRLSAETCPEKPCKPQPCPPVSNCQEITQADLPYIISEPGSYCVNTNLTYFGTGSAITINNVSNVKLHFNTASLSIANAAATGISISKSEEVIIDSDAIEHSASNPTGFGISIDQCNDITLNNLLLRNHFQGIRITNSRTVTINKSSIEQANNAGVFVELGTNILCNQVVFRDSAIGIHFSGTPSTAPTPNADCELNNCSFFNSTGIAQLYAQQIIGLVIHGCTFISEPNTPGVTTNVMRIGENVGALTDADVITIQDTIVDYQGTNTLHSAIGFFRSRRQIIDSVNLFTETGRGIFIQGLGIDIGFDSILRNSNLRTNGANPCIEGNLLQRMIIDTCTVTSSTTQDAISSLNSRGILITRCTLFPRLRIGGSGCMIVNNQFPRTDNTETSIVMGTSTGNTIQNNIVSNINVTDSDMYYIRNNTVRGSITVGSGCNRNALFQNYANTISLAAGSTNNYVVNNFVITLTNAGTGNTVAPNFDIP